MEPRINFYKASPEGINAMRGLEHYINQSSGLEPSLRELVKIRASQLNGCAYCIDMHWKDARVLGETEQRLYGLSAWREAPYYTSKERAALAWTEAITNIHTGHAPDAVYQEAHREFGDAGLA